MARAPIPKTSAGQWRGEIPIASLYTAGVGGQIFFKALKERGELVGTRCAPCEQVYVPARHFCERCFAELDDEVIVGPGGILRSFTLCYTDGEDRALSHPAAFGLIQLDGATGVLLHRLIGLRDVSRAAIGNRVTAVIRPAAKRTGSILDLEGFRLEPDGGKAGP